MGLAVGETSGAEAEDEGHAAHWVGLAAMASVLFFTLELLNQKDKLSHNQ